MNIFDMSNATAYHCAPMAISPSENTLPRQMDPRKLARQGAVVAGLVDVDSLSRIGDLLPSCEGVIRVELVFGASEQRVLTVSGNIHANIQSICQRCLGLMPLSLACELNLAIVWTEERAKQLPKCFDPWIVSTDQADIYQMVEEELLLSLPIVSYHDEQCVPKNVFSGNQIDTEVGLNTTEVANPFRTLESLKVSLKPAKKEVKSK